MMRHFLRILFTITLLTCSVEVIQAQYYSWGADRASLKWNTIQRDSVKILYPDNASTTARRMMHYIDTIKSDISYGFEHPQLKVPFVVHPENFISNGMVMWAPLRIEFLSTPATDSYSMPWVKQLVAHEYRHAVQYNNVDRSTTKILNYLLGQQGGVVSLLLPPLYALEGDAVMMETNMSTYGRGLQPSFSIGYRAMIDEMLDSKDYLRWRCGSYLTHIPDYYKMGYQMISFANEKYGENILDRAFEYISRNPQFIIPYNIALRKYYDTSTKELFYDTFSALKDYWEPLSKVENSAEVVSPSEKKNFITYSNPIPLSDSEVLAHKYDYKDPSRFVIFDTATSSERIVAHTGILSSRGGYAAGRVWWTEYRRSALFAEDVNSQICYMDIAQGQPQDLKGFKDALYPTPIGESTTDIAFVEYHPSGQYSVVRLCENKELWRTKVTYPNEVHSMAWDNATERLYIIVTGDDGMWIERQGDNGDFEPITKPAFVSLSSLSAHDGVLYFGSIASGKDEVHALDLATGVERQLSESTYGSFQPSSLKGEVYMTTYDKNGYHLSRQQADEFITEVEYSEVPHDVINPKRAKWDVINLDKVTFDSTDLAASEEEYKNRRYRKGTHLINVHSWAPIRFNPLSLLDEMSFDIGLGATLISQNLLSSSEGYFAYGWDHYQGSILQGGISYNGLGVNLSASATYGGEQNVYLVEVDQPLKRYANVSLSASLPLYYNQGYHTRAATPYVAWSYSNGILPYGLSSEYVTNPLTREEELSVSYKGIREGLPKLSFGVSYSDYVQAAYRDLTTPKGYTLSVAYATDPVNSDFADLISLYGKVYTPGLAKNNSFTIAAAYQDCIGGFDLNGYNPLSYVSSALIPHGFSYVDISNNNYFATSLEYKLPICYPELGFWNALYIKRLSMGVGFDYAQYLSYGNINSSINSYGVDLIVDLNAISLTSASTISTTFSLYKPKDRNLYFQFGLSLPI